jgi:hypothetical protein
METAQRPTMATYSADVVILREGQWQDDRDLFEPKGKIAPAAEPMNYRVNKTFIRGVQVFDFETRNVVKLGTQKVA